MSAFQFVPEGERELAAALLLFAGALKDPKATSRQVIEACAELSNSVFTVGMAPGERLLTTDEVCARLAVSAPTLRTLRGRDDFPAPVDLPESKKLRWRESDLDAYIRRLPVVEEGAS